MDNKNMKEKRVIKKRKLKISGIIFIILVIVFIIAMVNIIIYEVNLHKSKTLNNNIIEEVYEVVESNDNEENKENFTIDFDKLLTINSDIVGWIRYNKEIINFPITQSTDNSYYLTHAYDKSYNANGSIFLDYRNNSFNDKNTVLFGHNTITMFGSLSEVFKNDYFNQEENSYLHIMLPDNTLLTYRVFSYYVVEKEERYIQTSFSGESDFQDFLNLIQNRSYKKFPVDVTTNDKILTLSTCSGVSGTSKRKVVHFKLISEEER